MMFWKLAWLRKADGPSATVEIDPRGAEQLRSKLKTTTAPGQYFCQSTQLPTATQPNKRSKIFLKCIADVRSGGVSPSAMAKLIVVPLFRKIRDGLFGRPKLLGNLTRTPVGNLGLQPGDIVQVKSLEEMRATLDTKGRNRGLICDLELKQFCGMTYRVRTRLDRMISEATGKMRKVEGTVILEGNNCLCAWTLGGCPGWSTAIGARHGLSALIRLQVPNISSRMSSKRQFCPTDSQEGTTMEQVLQAPQTSHTLNIWKDESSGSETEYASVPIDKREKLSLKEFLHEYVLKNRPVVLTDAARGWKAISKWSPEFFREKYGEKRVPVFERKRSVTLKDMVLLKDYVNEITSSTFENRAKYLFSLKIPKELPNYWEISSRGPAIGILIGWTANFCFRDFRSLNFVTSRGSR